jgi:hypothetical protein
MHNFKRFLTEDLSNVLPYLKGDKPFPYSYITSLNVKWKPVGTVYRAFKVDWIDEIEQMFGSIPEVGKTYTYNRPPYTAWSKDKSQGVTYVGYEQPQECYFKLMCTPPVNKILCDFEQIEGYKLSKYSVEREVVLSGPLTVKVLEAKLPPEQNRWKR